MSGFGGGLATRTCDSLVINAQRSTPNQPSQGYGAPGAYRPIQNPNSAFAIQHWAFGVFLFLKLCPDWRMIGRFFSFPHVAIYSCRSTFLRQGFARQNRVDPQAAIFGK